MRIGIISDTHGHLDPVVRTLFQGVDHILHAGDFGFASILLELEDIAPVTAVLGNTDDPGTGYKELETVQLGGRTFVLHHVVDPAHLTERLQLALLHHSPDVIVYGHTHEAHHEVRDGRLFLNPGYAGRRKGTEHRSVAILRIEDDVEIDFIALD